MSRDNLRYGMVGGSKDAFIGNVHRIANRFSDHVALAAGCFSRDPEKNRQAAAQYGVERVYTSYEEMAEKEAQRSDGIDFVSIVTPNASHYAIAKAFLLHDIPVMCEKPLCLTVEQAQELVTLAEQKDLLFGVNYSYTGYAMVKLARDLVKTGKIGRVINVSGEFSQEWLIDLLGKSESNTAKLSVWRTDPAVTGISNCVGDIGTHIESVVSYVTGLRIRRVAAAVDSFGQELDLNANILVEYENGARGSYWCSQVSMGHYNDLVFRIFGTEGSVEWHQEEPERLKVCMKGQPMQYYYRGTGSIWGSAQAAQRLPSGHVEGLYTSFANVYRSYCTALLNKLNGVPAAKEEMDFPTVRDGLEGVKFLHAVIESGKRDSAWVVL